MADERRRRDLGAGKPLGSASTSSRCRCCPTCWPSRRRASRAPAKPGSSIATGRVTEGSSSNAWIVTRDGKVVTRQADHGILKGITRTVAARGDRGAGAQARRARLHARRGARRARGLHHLGEPDRACRWSRSTAGRSATARPGLIASALRRDFHRYAEISLMRRALARSCDLPEKHTILCSRAANLGLHAETGVPSNIRCPKSYGR